MHKDRDSFPLVLGAAGFLLWQFLWSSYESALQTWLLQELTKWFGNRLLADVMSRLLGIVPTAGLAALVIWFVVWYVRREFERTKEAFSVHSNVYAESHSIRSEDGVTSQTLYQNIFYLIVGHALPKGETIKNAQMRTLFNGPPLLARIKDSTDGNADLRHGEFLFFEIGRLITTQMFGFYQGDSTIERGRLDAAEHNVPLGHFSFQIYPHVGRGFNLGNNPNSPNVWQLHLVISGEDVVSKNVGVAVDVLGTTPVTINSASS